MPNGARLTAALCLALLAFIVSGLVKPLMPEGTQFGYFTHVNVALGLICGWTVVGRRAGRGVVPAINNGVTGMVVMVLWALFLQGAWEMFDQALHHRFAGPFEALAAIFTIGLEYFMDIAVPDVLWPLLIGGVLAGLAAESASRRWN